MKSATLTTPTVPNRTVQYIKPEGGIHLVYANHFQVANTVFDLRVIFGEVTNVNEKMVEITQKCQVTLSWLEAKALAAALRAYVDSYEVQNGPIKTEFPTIATPRMPEIPHIIPSTPTT